MNDSDQALQVQIAVELDAQLPRPCILCGVPTHNRGVFSPPRPAEYGEPPGKLRLIIYPMCYVCWVQPTALGRVEALLKERVLALEPQRWN